MEKMKKPNFRGGEDEDYCCAKKLFGEERLKESSEDFILPDYLPDVKKPVCIFPQAFVKNRFMGSGTLEYEGEVRYTLLYVAEDGTLKSVLFLTGFDDKIGNAEFTEDCVELLKPVCKGTSLRMINPRKLNVKSQNGVDAAVFKRISCMPELYGARTGDDERALVCRTEEVRAMNVLSLYENGLTLSEDISFDAVMPTAEELLFSGVTLNVQDCRVGEGEAQFRGTADLCCLLLSQPDASNGRELVKLEKTVVFSQTVKNEALHENGVCAVTLEKENCDFRLREDEFGQKRVLEFDLTYACALTVCYPKETALMTDCYSVEKETEAESAKESFPYFLSPLKGSFSVNESLPTDLPEDGGYTLETCFVFPSLHLSGEQGEKFRLSGDCAVYMLLRDSAGALDARRVSLPLSFRTDLPFSPDCDSGVSARVSGARFRLDKNVLTCDFEVGFCGCILGNEEKQFIKSLRILPDARAKRGKRGSILLCYAAKDETPFDVAKEYGVQPESIEKQMAEGAYPIMISRK